MNCIKCGSLQLRVVDSRPNNTQVWRRRECVDCGTRFNTIEISWDEFKSLKAKATELKLRYGK